MKAIELNQDNDRAWNCLGGTYRDEKRISDALSCLSRAVEINPNNDTAWSNLAYAFLDKKNYQEGISAINRAIELRPSNEMYWCNIVRIYLEQGLEEVAEINIEEGLKNAESIDALLLHKARVKKDRGNVEEAFDIIEKISTNYIKTAALSSIYCYPETTLSCIEYALTTLWLS